MVFDGGMVGRSGHQKCSRGAERNDRIEWSERKRKNGRRIVAGEWADRTIFGYVSSAL